MKQQLNRNHNYFRISIQHLSQFLYELKLEEKEKKKKIYLMIGIFENYTF